MSEQHTLEPWSHSLAGPGPTRAISSADHTVIARCVCATIPPGRYFPTEAEEAEAQANACRIVACVNACRGIPIKVLEQIIYNGGMVEFEGIKDE